MVDLCDFVCACPSPYHTVATIRSVLDARGFAFLPEQAAWDVRRGGEYYTIRNDSSIIAFTVGEGVCGDEFAFKVAATHSDSPTYRIKAVPELKGPGPYVRLNVEGYGGMIDRTWLDRPLGIAGRVLVQCGNVLERRLFNPNEDLLIIPSLAVHLDREVNKCGTINRQIDMCPLFSSGRDGTVAFEALIANRLGVREEQVLGYDLVLVNRQTPVVWGVHQEFVSAPRLDDLQCVYSSLKAFVDAHDSTSVQVFACFNNEEVGSGTMQGALSTFAPDVFERVSQALSPCPQAYKRAIARSFMVSCDNAQAVHPNHAELYDEGNRVWLNDGVVIKESASQKYTTDAVGRALFRKLCADANVPTQRFANRSDMAGGSTLGNLLQRQASITALDVGLPQLAMHSAYETAGAHDTAYLTDALRAFYNTPIALDSEGNITLG